MSDVRLDVGELAELYRQAQAARDETVRNILAQAVAQAAAAHQALVGSRLEVIGKGGVTEGPAVRRLQLLLAERGETIKVDGRYGTVTKKVVEGFQQHNGLTVDGWVGQQTWGALAGLAGGDQVGEAMAAKANTELEAFRGLSGKAVASNDLAAAETLAAEAVAAESLAAEAIAAETLAAEAAENRFSGEPLTAEAAIAESAVAEGLALTNTALQTFVAEATRPQG